MPPALILGSTSTYRAAALTQLGLKFTQTSPNVVEEHIPGESAETMALRLAKAKAINVARRNPGCVVIGADQTASCNQRILGKPGDLETAKASLAHCSGFPAEFYSALVVCCLTASGELQCTEDVINTRIRFRSLTQMQIDNYVAIEQPIDTAGAFKVESLGIALFESVTADDPTALVGLPLITLVTRLKDFAIDPLAGLVR